MTILPYDPKSVKVMIGDVEIDFKNDGLWMKVLEGGRIVSIEYVASFVEEPPLVPEVNK